jgi:class 3 adenylate cyclase
VDREVALACAFFADVARSTALRIELGEEEGLRRTTATLNAVRAAIQTHSGRIVDNAGDEYFAIFTGGDSAPSAAAQAAIDAQRAAKALGMGLYVGISCGPVKLNGEELKPAGLCVNMAARLHKLVDRAGLILADANTLEHLSMGLRPLGRSMGMRDIKSFGRVAVHSIDWDEGGTSGVPTSAASVADEAPAERDLEVYIGRIRHVFHAEDHGKKLKVGRSATKCSLALVELDVSGEHLDFVWESGNWFVRDTSRNGTWLRQVGQTGDVIVRAKTMLLAQKGRLGLGRPFEEDPHGATTLEFEQVKP